MAMETMEVQFLTPSEAYNRMQEIKERLDYRLAGKEELYELQLLEEQVADELWEGVFTV
jgi:hypothetical protein